MQIPKAEACDTAVRTEGLQQDEDDNINRLPTQQYMDCTVVPVLREGLRALNSARPSDPLQFLADYLLDYKKKPKIPTI